MRLTDLKNNPIDLEIEFELIDEKPEQEREILDLMIILQDRLEKYDDSDLNNEFKIARRFVIRSIKMLRKFF